MSEERGRPVGFGIVGCGGIGRWHARVLGGLPDAAAVAVTDLEPSRAKRLARASGARHAPSLEALLADPEVEVVSVCTPPSAHGTVIEVSARAGRHVLVEKPLTPTLAEADRAIEACREAGVRLGVVHQQRTRSAVRAVHRLLREGRLGRVGTATAIHTWYRSADGMASESWRGKEPGGGLLHDQAVHAIDLLLWLLGPCEWVAGGALSGAASGSGQASPGEGTTAVATLGMAGGVVATLTASTVANALRDDIALEIHGDRGSVRLEVRDYDHAEIAWLDLAARPGERARRLPPAEVETLVRGEGGAWRAGPARRPWRWLVGLAGAQRGSAPFRSPRAFLRRKLDRVAQVETGELQGHAAVLQRMAEVARGTADAPLVDGREARAGLAVIEGLLRSHHGRGSRIELGP